MRESGSSGLKVLLSVLTPGDSSVVCELQILELTLLLPSPGPSGTDISMSWSKHLMHDL